MKKRILLTGLLTIFSLVIFAKHVDEQTAKKVGQAFLTTKTNSQQLKSATNLSLAYKADFAINSTVSNQQTESRTYFYVFNVAPNGFVIVSGDDNVIPILAYSDEGSFDLNNIPNNAKKWLEEYKVQIRNVIENQIQATEEIKAEWQIFENGNNNYSIAATSSVSPLIQTKWNQCPYYNALCPGGSVTGCVATAMAQIMKYWNYPTTGTGFHSYNHDSYGTLSANFGQTTYQWSSMPNSVSSSNNAVATLMYHCGVSVDMDYSPESSGAYVISAKSPVQHCSEYAMKTYFGYKNTIKGVQRVNYDQTQWINLLKTELDAGRPILYAGFGSGGGHAFICDGYDNNNYFHFNWGWGGAYDGYFSINALNPSGTGTGGGTGSYNNGHQALIKIEPGTQGGGTTPSNYDMRLYSSLSISSLIWFGDEIALSVKVANYGSGSFNGQLGAAVFDENGHFLNFLEYGNASLGSEQYATFSFTNAGGPPFIPGTYYVAVFYKTNTQDWTIVADGNYLNIEEFEIYYSTDIEVNSNFNYGTLTQNSSATVNVDVLNTGSSTFYGKFKVSLSNLDGTWAQNIDIVNCSDGLPSNYHYTNGLNFTGTITVEPGTYLMEVAYQEEGTSTWYYAGSSDYSNPIFVTVVAPPIQPDMYENNNTQGKAYNLTVNFSGNKATKNTAGSNFHIENDLDYYKIVLPSGYNYTITPRLHDEYNSGNGQTYSVDALFSYSTDGSTYSETYDDIMSGNITMKNGGTVYFKVVPYFQGSTGTYLLDMSISRVAVNAIEDVELESQLSIFPNPASSELRIKSEGLKINSIEIIDLTGKVVLVSNKTEINVLNLSDGTYFVNIHSDKGILTKKLIVKK
ncbi:MAG TPA: thiol protease/hemagglutinin PrtT [Bacteroidales bacterium]|nr:thiol protease/hemagglutinin PrtT [Bacteroidales bacterium]HOR82524.1 thiol protease/hemagglutinin PrtT [Bacteroidales bacterium]HPJ91258.1 thiol protease/hemagglutinin PrtT [Bacteroidales bacterium]